MLIQIKVKTNQKISSITGDIGSGFVASLKASPTQNKANFELIDLISDLFNVPKNKVKIKLGKYSHQKTLYIDEQVGLL